MGDKMSPRTPPHIIETNVLDNVRKIINRNDCLYREVTGRDYGIDAIVEFFNKGEITGKLALIQVKGTKGNLKFLRKNNVISCKISSSNAKYALQKNIPVILICASMAKENVFYYVCLQEVNINISKLKRQKTITVHIPEDNIVESNISDLRRIVDKYYSKNGISY